MKKNILVLLIIVSSCMNTKLSNSQNLIKKVSINLQLKGCVDREDKVITFIIHNDNSFGFWIHSWHLVLDSITTKNGIVIIPNALIEPRAPNIPEYSWVNPMSELRISYSTSYFKKFTLKSGEYYLFASYDKYVIRKKHSKGITLLQPINIGNISFVRCN
jgi:hypothetical protein